MKREQTTFDCLAVTQVEIFPLKGEAGLGRVKALAVIVLNDQIKVRGLRVMDGNCGLFVSYPTDPFYNGEGFHSVVMPITR